MAEQSVREKLMEVQLLSIIQDLGLERDCAFVDILNTIYHLQNPWTPVDGIQDMPIGNWIVAMEDGGRGVCEIAMGSNSKFGVINGQFYFDYSKVVAYMPLPKYNGGDGCS